MQVVPEEPEVVATILGAVVLGVAGYFIGRSANPQSGQSVTTELPQATLPYHSLDELANEQAPPPPPVVDEDLKTKLTKRLGKHLEKAIYNADKSGREEAQSTLRKTVTQEFAEQGADPRAVAKLYESIEKELVRSKILKDGKRPDGRKTNEIRPISIEVGVMPRAHGSGLFTRGQTRMAALTV